MIVENVDCQGKQKFSEKTCPRATLFITKSHMTRPEFEPGPPRWEAGDYYSFLYLVCEAIGTAPTTGLLCQPRVIVKMIVEKQMERRMAGETEVLGENLPQRQFCPSQNPT
jgi:hypothetical protein